MWENLKRFFGNDLRFPCLTPQTVFFGFLSESKNKNSLLMNHILLIFKIYTYNCRQTASVSLQALLNKIIKIKKIEKNIATRYANIFEQFKAKWQVTDVKLKTD